MHSSLIHLIQFIMKTWRITLEVNMREGEENIRNNERTWETSVGHLEVHIVNSRQDQWHEHLNATFTTVLYHGKRLGKKQFLY